MKRRGFMVLSRLACMLICVYAPQVAAAQPAATARSKLAGAGAPDRDHTRRGLPHRRTMRLGSAARVAATATGIIAVVYVLGVIVLNLVVSARLAQQNDNRLADRLAAASHDQDVFSQPAPRTFRGAGDGDADSAPVFFWLLDARQAVTAQSPGAPVLPARPLGGQQPRDGLAVTVNVGRARRSGWR